MTLLIARTAITVALIVLVALNIILDPEHRYSSLDTVIVGAIVGYWLGQVESTVGSSSTLK